MCRIAANNALIYTTRVVLLIYLSAFYIDLLFSTIIYHCIDSFIYYSILFIVLFRYF